MKHSYEVRWTAHAGEEAIKVKAYDLTLEQAFEILNACIITPHCENPVIVNPESPTTKYTQMTLP